MSSSASSSRQQPRPRRITRAASRAAAAALLSDSPGEVVAHILKQCEPRDFGALACTAQWLHPLLELALRLRAGENGHALPKKLPLGDDSCHRRVQVLLSLERRRAQLGRRTIAAGMSHSLFISPEGTLLSCGTEWDVDGNPTPGLLGHGALAEEELPANSIHVPTPLPGLASVRIRSVAAGVSLSLAVTFEGEVYSWGQGNMGQLGHGIWASSQSTPRQITALASERVVAVEAGFIHALALAESGAVYSWGAGGDGRLGHGNEEHLSTPRRIEALAGRHVRAVAAGYESSLALTADGAVLSWGRGALGQLGHGGNPTPRSEPLPHVIDAFRGTPIAAVTAGNKRSLALSRSGGVYSWGDGAGGQLGHGDETHEDAPKLVSALARLDVAMVVAGASHSFALTADGALYSWGAGQCGRLGHGDESKQLLPKRVDGLSSVKVVSVSGGAFHSLAADERGNVYGWGDGDGASLGLQLTQDQLEPRQYPNGLQAAR